MVEPSVPADERDEDRFLRELLRIQAEQDDEDVQEEVWDPSVAATRKMLQVCQAAQGVGLKTVATLDEQGEQLNHVGRSLGDITRDLDSVEEDLSKIQRSCFGRCCPRCLWKRRRKTKPIATVSPSPSSPETPDGSRHQSVPIEVDPEDEVSLAVSGLKGIAEGMGKQLTGQSEQITALTASASSSTERLARASESAETILRDG